MTFLLDLLPVSWQPYAKAVWPALLTLATTGATAVLVGLDDPATLHTAAVGAALALLALVIPNGDGPNLLPAALRPYAKAFWTGTAALVSAGVGLLFGVPLVEDELRTVVLGLVLTGLTFSVPNETAVRVRA